MITLQQKNTTSFIIQISKLNLIEYFWCLIIFFFDSIWEPPLDISFDEDEAELFVKEAHDLTDCVTQVEMSFASKPLETISLPKPLEKYTWLSVAKSINYVHNYIAEKNMVIFFVIL